ncbi:Dolichyl-diphosphooligosaccharide-protein glycosyltransferase [Russula ochroleuca]|jgi:oligosaccharyltransferase complex subunit beta|uniref:Dolichyl-diphosphooligosaccharide--protein glycosyltransferase subunit WBP1 n=1 Tax=Russula ochroleuca TaxID=152965 RepID=A0A9P5JYF1_9AGAM|nr:Dolichyl-diphosphooligosaccharide-protein glycosyltransferase [Russula ochroleuca]
MLLSLGAFFFSFFSLFCAVRAKSSTGNSVLVVLQPNLKRDNFTIFFDNLEKRGYDLTFRAPKADTPLILQYDVPSFSHIILFAPDTKSFSQDITPQTLVAALNAGTNLIIALSPTQSPIFTLASEFSLILPPPGTPLISHFPARDTPPSVIPVPVPPDHPLLTPNTAPVWFSGIPFAHLNNPLLVPILHAPAESFASDTDSDSGAEVLFEAAERGGEGLWAGRSLGIVTGFQTRDNNARVTWVGGIELFSDAYANKLLPSGARSGNEQFALDIASWTFQESLVLRIDSTTHHLINETAPREHYTINEDIVFEAHISRYDHKRGWSPYSGLDDLQVEFTMLDPHIRTALLSVSGKSGLYRTSFRVPDRHGVFKFVVDHRRRGWTTLKASTMVPVVPPRHDGYPRFLSAAWPYYVGAISTSVGFLIFAALWLAGDDKEERKKGKGTKTE